MYESENNPIYLKWKAAGGKNVLGDALRNPQFILSGRATYQPFANGAIFNSPVFDAVLLANPILNKWLSLKTDLQAYFGNPVGDSFQAANGTQAAYFERGMIIVHPNGQAFEVHGFIYAHYRKHGDVNGFLGLPIGDEEVVPNGGYRSQFEGGNIYWHSDAGVCAIYGAIHEHWIELSSIHSALGYPVTDEQPVMKDGVEIGRSSRFQGGAIFWKQDTGAWEVHGAIREVWETVHGGATGYLGFPVSDERDTPTSGGKYSNFEHGVIVWHPNGSYAGTYAFNTMELYVQRLIGTGGDGAGDSGLEIYIFHHIEVQNRVEGNAVISNGRQPGSGYWDRSEVNVGWNFSVTDCVQGELQLIVMFEGWDYDDSSGNDRLGTINRGLNISPYNKLLQPAYSVDNLWGYLEDTRHDQSAFHVDYIIRGKAQPYDPNKAFREQWFWKFNNFSTPKLDKQTYADTFSDVDNQGIQWINPLSYIDEGWEALYYHVVYKGAAKNGNCFGICLEAIYAIVQRSLFTEPIYQFGNPQANGDPDPNLDHDIIREINIKHGYQLGSECIYWFLRQLFGGMTHNPKEVFGQSLAAYQRGDYPILSISQFWGGNGHAVLPFKWNDQVEPWEIWIADPNFEWNSGGDSDDQHKILIYSDDHFEYHGGNSYNGSTSEVEGARLFYTPYSVLSHEPSTPSLEALELILSGVVVLLAEDGETTQITDEAGRTLYEPNLGGAPTQWGQIRHDPDQRIPGLARVPLISQNVPGAPLPELYYLQGTPQSLHYQVRAKQANGTYYWGMRSPTLDTIVTIHDAPTATDTISMEQVGTNQPAVSLRIAPNGEPRKANLRIQGWAGVNSTQRKSFTVHDLVLTPSHRLRLHLKEAGQALHIDNFGAKVTFQVSGNGSSRRNVTIEAGKSIRIRPQWQQLDAQWQIGSKTTSLRKFLESKGFNPGIGVRSPYLNIGSLRDLMDE